MARATGLKNLARVRIALVLYESDDTKSAIYMLTSAIDRKKAESRDDAYYLRNIFHENEGEIASALHQYLPAIDIKSDYHSALSARSEFRFRLGEINQ